MKVKEILVTRDRTHHHHEYVVALAEDGTLWWTSDLGATWTSMKEPGPEHSHGPDAACTTICPAFERPPYRLDMEQVREAIEAAPKGAMMVLCDVCGYVGYTLQEWEWRLVSSAHKRGHHEVKPVETK